MSFLAPFALWGLFALAVPVALHLRRRRVGRTVQVGSVRHLESLPTAERRGLRLREPWLLLLRAAVLTLLVLLLAGPALDRPVRVGRPVALVDSAAGTSLIDSLGRVATLLVERVDDPWGRLTELDDSLPDGVPMVVAASTSSDRFEGPRPTVARAVTWIPIGVTRPVVPAATRVLRPTSPASATESKALSAAAAAVAEAFGPLKDTSDWMAHLPEWWRDSLTTSGFPVTVAQALAPAKTLPLPVPLSIAQLIPRRSIAVRGGSAALDLHWWVWALALLLFAVERLWSLRRRGRA